MGRDWKDPQRHPALLPERHHPASLPHPNPAQPGSHTRAPPTTANLLAWLAKWFQLIVTLLHVIVTQSLNRPAAACPAPQIARNDPFATTEIPETFAWSAEFFPSPHRPDHKGDR